MEHGTRQTLDKLRELIGRACEIDPSSITENARLRGYGVDSIRVMDIMLSLEEELQIEFRIEDLDSIRTVGELAEYVGKLQAARTAVSENTDFNR